MVNSDDELYLKELCQNDKRLTSILRSYDAEHLLTLSRFNHEIRNPLTLIYSTMQLLSHKQPELGQNTYWNQMHQDMNDLFQLLDQFSNFTHANQLQLTNVNFTELLTDLKISFEPFAKEKNSHINIIIKNTSYPYINSYICDYTKMKQVFTNIIKNAIEAIDHNGLIQLITEVKTYKSNPSLAYLCISVVNDGTPIRPEMLEQIFTPCVTTKATGSGLGLPIARQIITSHHGFIRVTSNWEETVFYINLPITSDLQNKKTE